MPVFQLAERLDDSYFTAGMHGSVIHGFKQFVLVKDGPAAWDSIAASAGSGGWYHATQIYPDDEFKVLVDRTAAHWQRPVSDVVAEFGESLAPVLLDMYQAFVDRRWRTLDLLMASESVIHRTVRMRDPLASPPQLQTERVRADEVHIRYASPRRLCAIAVGLCRGLAAHFRERVSIDQPQCMERGDPNCRLVVRQLP